MTEYARILDIDLPRDQSAFLWGPRKTGKSTLLRRTFPRSARFDLLDTRLMLEFTRAPWTLADRVRALDPAPGPIRSSSTRCRRCRRFWMRCIA